MVTTGWLNWSRKIVGGHELKSSAIVSASRIKGHSFINVIKRLSATRWNTLYCLATLNIDISLVAELAAAFPLRSFGGNIWAEQVRLGKDSSHETGDRAGEAGATE